MRTLKYVVTAYLATTGCIDDTEGEITDDEALGEVDQEIEYPTREDTLSTTTPTRNAVVMIGGFCTGTLIAPTIVLTAAHCGWADHSYMTGGWTTIPDLTIFIGPVRGSWLGTATANAVSAPPLATAGPWLTEDIVLLRLTAPVPSSLAIPRPTYVDRPVTLSSSSTIYQVGYGGGRNRRYMTGSNYTDWLLPDDRLVNGFGYVSTLTGDGIGDRGDNIEGGDSGGPMLLGSDTGYVMGELSHWEPYGIATFGPGGEGRPSIRNWLQAKAPQKPDFDVISITAAGCTGSGGDPTVRVQVKNKGVRTLSARVDVFHGLALAPAMGTTSTINRASGQVAPEQTVDLYFALPGVGAGSRWVDVLLDTSNILAELDESNNTGAAYLNLPDCSFN